MFGVENYIHEIDAWVSSDDHETNTRSRKNIPLIITGEQGCGKSSVMAHWLDFHQRSHKKNNDFVVVHFAHKSPADRVYFYSLYRMFNRLREEFDIKQKMPILEDKLRVYFSRWLELANAKRESELKRQRIILIFDGIERYRDSSGKEETPDWIPTESPNGVYLVYVVSQESRSFKILMNKAKLTLTIGKLNAHVRDQMLAAVLENYPLDEMEKMEMRVKWTSQLIATDERCANALFTSLLLNLLFVKSMQFPLFPIELVEKCGNSEALFIAAMDFYCTTDVLKKVLACLALTRSGLTEDELKILTGVQFEQFYDMVAIFSVFISSYQGLYQICVDSFREIVLQRLILNPVAFHLDIADVVESQRFTVRNVQEQVHHLYESGNWMRLKDKLVSLEVFCVLMTPDYKLELAMYWQKLESCHFDVVQEYNRSLELFVENNHLGNQELFVLVVQFCRLFKELTDFETELTPEFKHPHLRGQFELKEINLLEEVRSIPGMYSEKQLSAIEEHEQFNIENNISREQLKESILKMIQEGSPQRSQPKFYYYKRWLWIQFPWGALDVYSNLSQTMGKFNSFHEVVSQEIERELGVVTLKIINKSAMHQEQSRKEVKIRKPLRTSGSESRLNRSTGSKVYSFLPKLSISKNELSGIFTPTQSLTEEQYLKTVQPPKFRPHGKTVSNVDRDFSFDVMFKELTPENVLVKLGAQVVHYSNHEIAKKVKENHELQRTFNKLANERKQKLMQLAGLQSQLAKSVDKAREQEEIRQQIHKLQHKIESTYERLNKEELERKRLEQVVVSCFKNPARNDEWERSLDKYISNIKTYVDLEMKEIEQYELEKEQLNSKIKEFEMLFKDKIVYQNHTIDRVAEQFMMKANFKETLINGERRRQRVIRLSNLPKKLEYYREQLREQEKKRKTLAGMKTAIKEKLAECQAVFTKLQESGFITHPSEMINIIFQLEKNEELKVTQSRLEAKIYELEREKETLQTKLKFFKQKQREVPLVSTSTLTEQIDSLQLHNAASEKHLTQISILVKKQELLVVECSAIVEHIRKMLKMPEEFAVEKGEICGTLSKCGERLIDFERKIRKVLGFSAYSQFIRTFPEILSVQQVACSNADNIRVKISSPEAEMLSGTERDAGEKWKMETKGKRRR